MPSVLEKIYLVAIADRKRTSTLELLRVLAVSFLLLNSAVNFFIYLLLRRFQRALKTVLWCL